MGETGETGREIGNLLAEQGVAGTRIRFRVPALPGLSAAAGFLACSGGSLLLFAARPVASFFLSLAGGLLLLLDAGGFSPLAWIGPKEERWVAVVEGDPSEPGRPALFLAIPARCRLTPGGQFSRRDRIREAARALGTALALLFPVLPAGSALLLFPPPVVAGAGFAVLFAVLSFAEAVRRERSPGPENLAAGWIGTLRSGSASGRRPWILLYPGDPAEVKFLLARFRGPLFRGRGLFLEWSGEAAGLPAVSAREGSLPAYRCDPQLVAAAAGAAREAGTGPVRTTWIPFRTGAFFAMSRGFRAVTLFREPGSGPDSGDRPGEPGAEWAVRTARAAAPPN